MADRRRALRELQGWRRLSQDHPKAGGSFRSLVRRERRMEKRRMEKRNAKKWIWRSNRRRKYLEGEKKA